MALIFVSKLAGAMAAHHRLIVIPVDHSLSTGKALVDPVTAPV